MCVRKKRRTGRRGTAKIRRSPPVRCRTVLQGDLIQPLVIRANQGDCLRITLRNQIADEPTNMIVNGSQMLVASTGKPATANNPDALVPTGKIGEFEWYIPIDLQEGGRAFHSHATQRAVFLGPVGFTRGRAARVSTSEPVYRLRK